MPVSTLSGMRAPSVGPGIAGVPPERILLVGDTNHDQEIAARLGARFVHFERGHQDLPAVDGAQRIAALGDLLQLI